VDNSVAIGNGSIVQLWHCWGGDNQRWFWSVQEGTFMPGVATWACLDDEHGGSVAGTPSDIWDCAFRATPRWNLDQVYIKTIADKCLDTSAGKARYTGCLFGSQFQWTYTPDAQLKRFGVNRCLTFGGVGSQPFMADCDPNRDDQKIFRTGAGNLITSAELCLEVPEPNAGGLFTGASGAIRVRECEFGKLSQQFYFQGFFRSNAGLCFSHQPTDISRNGLRAAPQTCSGSPGFVFWDYYIL
jgi:hypothetical protein